MKHLFLTGPVGCGKSTAILSRLGHLFPQAGGLRTLRQRDAAGNILGYTLESPDGSRREWFLECAGGSYIAHPEVFSTLGTQLLRSAPDKPWILLDEIGGFEVLDPGFMEALDAVLNSGVPCIGVIKGPGPADALNRRLQPGPDYAAAARSLRLRLEQMPQTRVYECRHFDPEAPALVELWKQLHT